jgi:rubredoxin
MYLETRKEISRYTRTSKLGLEHTYCRAKSVAVFRCDNCDNIFQRDLGKMDYRRISNRFFHVCPNCDAKKFAQRKGVERRKIWDMPVDSDLDISRI